jgi:hypothetical protein
MKLTAAKIATVELEVLQASVNEAHNAALKTQIETRIAELEAENEAEAEADDTSSVVPTFKRAASAKWFNLTESAKILKVLHVGAPTTSTIGREVREAICQCSTEFMGNVNLRVAVWTNDDNKFTLPVKGQGLTISKGKAASNGEFWITVSRRESDEIEWTEESVVRLELKGRAADALRKISAHKREEARASATVVADELD